jgi:hypothetical protein
VANYRRSYWKTTAVACVAGAGSATAAIWLLSSRGESLAARVLEPTVALVAVAIALCLLLIAAGGFIALHRDLLEATGIPYARLQPRERRAGPIVLAVQAVVRAIRAPFRRDSGHLGLYPGELVAVRSFDEIRQTLDDRGTLNGLIFMPEMLAACGREFRVFRRVDKLHDWLGRTGLRRVHDTVLLEGLRCDGSGHDGCQSGCYVRWNEAWLRRVTRRGASPYANMQQASVAHAAPSPQLYQLARRRSDDGSERMVCQTTLLAAGTSRLSYADPRHYLRDLVTGNIAVRPLLTGVAIAAFNAAQRLRGGSTFPNLATPDRKSTPHVSLDLEPGEMVRVKTKREIEETLNAASRNRGLWFDVEMLRYCGGEYRVSERIARLLDERAGTMRLVTNPCIRLEGIAASGEYLGFCAQNELIFWREIWLSRVESRTAARAPQVVDAVMARVGGQDARSAGAPEPA